MLDLHVENMCKRNCIYYEVYFRNKVVKIEYLPVTALNFLVILNLLFPYDIKHYHSLNPLSPLLIKSSSLSKMFFSFLLFFPFIRFEGFTSIYVLKRLLPYFTHSNEEKKLVKYMKCPPKVDYYIRIWHNNSIAERWGIPYLKESILYSFIGFSINFIFS